MRQTRQYDTCKCVLDLVFLQQGVSLEIGNYCTLSLFFEQIALSQ